MKHLTYTKLTNFHENVGSHIIYIHVLFNIIIINEH